MGIDYEDFIQEFQSRPDHTMPVRVMSFMALLWQVLIRLELLCRLITFRELFQSFCIMVNNLGMSPVISKRRS